MNIDLKGVPFSRNGAYMAFSLLPEAGEQPAGLYLRSVHGGANAVRPGGRVARVAVISGGNETPFTCHATPDALELRSARGSLWICIADPWLVRLRGDGVGLRLIFDATLGDYAYPASGGRWHINCPGHQLQWMATPIEGILKVDAPWTGTRAERVALDMCAAENGATCEAALEEVLGTWRPRVDGPSSDDCREEVAIDYAAWLARAPRLPEAYETARQMAVYINWSSMVEPVGHFLRPSMLMSKNAMSSVWSWDHCFNARALAYHKQFTAWDQLMTIFDQQDEYGALPDSVNDRSITWNFCKPPIHGWTLNWMMDRCSIIRKDQARQIYGPLCRWTEWWFRYRDDDRDGAPEYHHGNDSGWDNATPFDLGVPLESPDLCAYLVLQMETLARLAEALQNNEEAESWQRRSEDLMQTMLVHFWQGDHFAAMRSGDHQLADTDSLFLYLPIVLGRRLPVVVQRDLVAGLLRPGRFLTEHGLATESPQSPAYQPDGYWRGPIWSLSTLLMVDGLAACGEADAAADIARRFCDMCARSGFAENFDALTGEGLRDPAYTWTSSVFLELGREYLF